MSLRNRFLPLRGWTLGDGLYAFIDRWPKHSPLARRPKPKWLQDLLRARAETKREVRRARNREWYALGGIVR